MGIWLSFVTAFSVGVWLWVDVFLAFDKSWICYIGNWAGIRNFLQSWRGGVLKIIDSMVTVSISIGEVRNLLLPH